MHKIIKSIVVVGGGTAGWITAGRIAADHCKKNIEGESAIKVTLIESPNVNIVGVGEGTWPTMRNTLSKLKISETDFIKECDATFKQGAKFARWVDGSKNDFYYHPLVLPQGFSQINLASHWLGNEKYHDTSFANAVCFQEQVCEKGLAPKLITTPEYASVANYAYHLDARKFADFLQRHCTEKLGVQHILDDVENVNFEENGDIASLSTTKSGPLEGDLFIDCTGFSSLLLGKHYEVPFIDHSDTLFIDNALAVQLPYENNDDPIASHTISTAQTSGWIWDIGLSERRGVGYVYSSRHTNTENAEQELRKYIGEKHNDLELRRIPIRCGHRKQFWQNNCVAVGLSAGFLEPLEASSLVLVELSAQMISEQLPACREVMDIVAKRFNTTFQYRWDRIIDFLKLHYLLSQRTDSQFWKDNRDPDTIPESLSELLTLWKYHPPGNCDFTSNNEVFPAASYQYVLYGMGFETEVSHRKASDLERLIAQQQFEKNNVAIKQATQSLPSHRKLIEKIHTYGFQRI